MKRKTIAILMITLLIGTSLLFTSCGNNQSSGETKGVVSTIELPCNLSWDDTSADVEAKLKEHDTGQFDGYYSTSFMGYDYWYAMPEYDGGDVETIEVWALWLGNDHNVLPHPDWEDIVSQCTELYGEPIVADEANYKWEKDGVKIAVSWNTEYENGNIAYTRESQ